MTRPHTHRCDTCRTPIRCSAPVRVEDTGRWCLDYPAGDTVICRPCAARVVEDADEAMHDCDDSATAAALWHEGR